MTNEELKKKIVKIISQTWEEPVQCTAERKFESIADALIAAGLTFDGEWKHRADVAERAARDLITYYCGYTIEKDIDNSLRVALQQAEKELEEGKND